MTVVVRDREALQLGHHLIAERGRDTGADGRGEAALGHAHDREQHAGEGEREHHDQQCRLKVGRDRGARLEVGRRCIGPS